MPNISEMRESPDPTVRGLRSSGFGIVVGDSRSKQQLRLLRRHSDRHARHTRQSNSAIADARANQSVIDAVTPPNWYRLWVRDPEPQSVVARYRFRPIKREWVTDGRETVGPDPFAHLFNFLTTDTRVPGELVAVTYCQRHYLKELKILGPELNRDSPCLECLDSVQFNGNAWNPLRGATLDIVNIDSGQRGKYLSPGCFQHIEIPSDPRSAEQWAWNIASVAGEAILQCLRQVLWLVGMPESSELDLRFSELPAIVSQAPKSFNCLRCGREQPFAGLLERLHGPAAMGPDLGYPRSIDLVRVGPSMVCNVCRRKTFGSRYRNPVGSRLLPDVLRRYAAFHGQIPDLRWSQRPILHSIVGQSSRRRSLELEGAAVDLAIAMPNVRAPEFMEQRRQGGSLWWMLLERAGLVETVRGGRFGIQAIADDGHYCLSMLEWRFCNALARSGIEHEKEPKYVHWKRIRADFRVGDLLIEIAGLAGREEYDIRMSRKLAFAKAEKLRVLVLNESDIARFDAARRVTIDDFEQLWQDRR